MEVVGKVVKVGEIQKIGSKGFQKRDLVLETDDQFPQKILIEFTGDRVALIGTYKPGELVKVGINLRGREWTSPDGEVKYFNSIVGWRIDKSEGNAQPVLEEEQGDLPF